VLQDDGLPLGLQIAGFVNGDAHAFAIAAAIKPLLNSDHGAVSEDVVVFLIRPDRRALEDQRGHGFGAFGKAPACEGQVPGPRR
jgi:hypothetical protein